MEMMSKGSLFAVAMIVAGALLFLDNLSILPIGNIGAYWPLALVVYGLGVISHRRNARSAVWSGTLILAGILLVLGNLGILNVTIGGLWPLMLMAAGLLMLLEKPRWHNPEDWAARFERKMERKRWRRDRKWEGFSAHRSDKPFAPNQINEVAVFFSLNKKVDSQDFGGGEVVSVFGSVELDLTGAKLAMEGTERRAIIEASTVFGAVEIKIPLNWRVVKEGTGVFGAYEDRTILRPLPGEDTCTLVIRGGAVFGAVTIRN